MTKFTISRGFARRKGIPVTFRGVVLRETARAVYIYGQGMTDPRGRCTVCGATLTHPGSILIGVGPECLSRMGLPGWAMRAARAQNPSQKDIDRIRQLMERVTIDSWFPRSVIKSSKPAEDGKPITIPKNHPMNTAKSKSRARREKRAELLDNGTILIRFPFDRDTVAKVKTLEGRRWRPDIDGKPWTCPFSLENVERLREWGFKLGDELEERDKLLSDGVEVELDIPNEDKLYPFQADGVRFIERKGGRALIADEMGLGKTIQALTWLAAHPEKRPALIICPASVKLNWAKECRIWCESDVQVLSGRKPHPTSAGIVIINYDILPAWLGSLAETKWAVMVVDEIHFIKNSKAQRTKAAKKLGKGIPHIIGLSGTPIVNRPIEIYNAAKLIEPGCLPGFFSFIKRYCGAYHDGFGWKYDGASNTDELHKRLTDTVMIRRRKEDVLEDLPAKIRSVIPLDIINRREYDRAEKDFLGWLRDIDVEKATRAEAALALVKIEALKQLTIKGKIGQCVEWIRDFVETNGKLVVFSTHKDTIDRLMEEFKTVAVRYDGSTGSAAREKAIDEFQGNPDVRLFIGNMKAAGVGITLTAASATCFVELGWTPGEHEQAEDRVHRIGQEADSVHAYYLIADRTIEEEISELLDQKRQVLDQVLDGKVASQESMLTELLDRMKNQRREV